MRAGKKYPSESHRFSGGSFLFRYGQAVEHHPAEAGEAAAAAGGQDHVRIRPAAVEAEQIHHPQRVPVEQLKQTSAQLAAALPLLETCEDLEQLRGLEGEAA